MEERNTERLLLAAVYFTFLFMTLWMIVQALPSQEPITHRGVMLRPSLSQAGVAVHHMAFQ